MTIDIITPRHTQYHKSPAEARCHCGMIISLSDSLDNVCEVCGRCYNMCGQEVTPSSQCDEQGEPCDDY